MKFRDFRQCIHAVAAVLLMASAIGPAKAADPKTVRVSVINISDVLALYVAVDQQMFAKRGLTVDITPVGNQSVIVSSLVSGAADIGFSVPPTMIQAKDNGIDLKIVCGATEFPIPKPLYAGILARTGSNIHSAGDLVGKKVGVIGLNAFHHIMARRWLAENRVDPDKVSFVEIGLPQMSDLMKAGQIDAAVTVDPFYHRMIDQGIGYSFDDYLKTVPDGVPIDFYMATENWTKANPETSKAFGAAIAEANDFIRAHDDSARESLAKWTKLPPVVVASTRMPNFSVRTDAKEMAWWLALLKEQGLISGKMQGADFLTAP